MSVKHIEQPLVHTECSPLSPTIIRVDICCPVSEPSSHPASTLCHFPNFSNLLKGLEKHLTSPVTYFMEQFICKSNGHRFGTLRRWFMEQQKDQVYSPLYATYVSLLNPYNALSSYHYFHFTGNTGGSEKWGDWPGFAELLSDKARIWTQVCPNPHFAKASAIKSIYCWARSREPTNLRPVSLFPTSLVQPGWQMPGYLLCTKDQHVLSSLYQARLPSWYRNL